MRLPLLRDGARRGLVRVGRRRGRAVGGAVRRLRVDVSGGDEARGGRRRGVGSDDGCEEDEGGRGDWLRVYGVVVVFGRHGVCVVLSGAEGDEKDG